MDTRKHLIAASILSADFSCLAEEIRRAEQAGADWIHCDITDGHFVENLTMGTLAVKAARKTTSLPLDVHLMIEHPERFVELFARCGADCISVHYETALHLTRTVQLIRDAGIKPGVALGPSVPVSHLEWILDDIDYVLILAVSPGFGGQRYIPNTMERIRQVSRMIERSGREILIQSDGGINLETVQDFSRAGVNVFTVGSALFGSDDYARTIREFHTRIDL